MTAASAIPDAGSAERPRVLLADDHPAVLALTGECFVVGSVGDGRALLAEAERLHPDVIVLDITMPALDGIEAARQLKRAECRAKLVFLTVHEDLDYVRTALHAGGAALRRQGVPGLRPHHGHPRSPRRTPLRPRQ